MLPEDNCLNIFHIINIGVNLNSNVLVYFCYIFDPNRNISSWGNNCNTHDSLILKAQNNSNNMLKYHPLKVSHHETNTLNKFRRMN